MNACYIGTDGNIHRLGDNQNKDSLKHWKYIKKIPSGKGFRYFYTQDELRAYYNEMKGAASEKWDYAKPQKPSTMGKKIRRDESAEYNRWGNERDRIYNSDKKMDREIERARKEYKRDRNAKNWKRLSDANEKGRDVIYKDNIHAYIENERKHDEETRKIADRRYNYNRYKRNTDKAKKIYDKTSNAYSSIKKESSDKVNKGKSAIEKKTRKIKKTTKSEIKGAKRASNAIKGRGAYNYDGHNTAPKTYYKYDKKKKKNRKVGKTGRVERSMIGAYRRTHPYE